MKRPTVTVAPTKIATVRSERSTSPGATRPTEARVATIPSIVHPVMSSIMPAANIV